MIKKEAFENQLKQHSIKHTRSNTQEKTFVDCFLWATFSENFAIATVFSLGTKKLVWDSE